MRRRVHIHYLPYCYCTICTNYTVVHNSLFFIFSIFKLHLSVGPIHCRQSAITSPFSWRYGCQRLLAINLPQQTATMFRGRFSTIAFSISLSRYFRVSICGTRRLKNNIVIAYTAAVYVTSQVAYTAANHAMAIRNSAYVLSVFLPRDAMHKRGLCCHAVCVCVCVRYVRGLCQNE